MVTVKQLKNAAKDIMNNDSLDEKYLVKVAMMLLDLADQLEFLEEKDTVSDSQIGLLKDVNETWKDDSLQCQTMLAEEQAINLELRKQIVLLKEALTR